MNSTPTTKDFFEYLNDLDLLRLKIWEDETGMNAIVNSKPDLERFTQVKQVPESGGLYQVRLSKNDYHNELITKGFFG